MHACPISFFRPGFYSRRCPFYFRRPMVVTYHSNHQTTATRTRISTWLRCTVFTVTSLYLVVSACTCILAHASFIRRSCCCFQEHTVSPNCPSAGRGGFQTSRRCLRMPARCQRATPAPGDRATQAVQCGSRKAAPTRKARKAASQPMGHPVFHPETPAGTHGNRYLGRIRT